MANLEQLKQESDDAEKAFNEAGERRNEALERYELARVEAMAPELVEEAESLGINPRNYEDEQGLQFAVDQVKREQENQEG